MIANGLERLRGALVRRGVAVPALLLGGIASADAALSPMPAPARLAASVAAGLRGPPLGIATLRDEVAELGWRALPVRRWLIASAAGVVVLATLGWWLAAALGLPGRVPAATQAPAVGGPIAGAPSAVQAETIIPIPTPAAPVGPVVAPSRLIDNVRCLCGRTLGTGPTDPALIGDVQYRCCSPGCAVRAQRLEPAAAEKAFAPR